MRPSLIRAIQQRQRLWFARIANAMDFNPFEPNHCVYHAIAGIYAGIDHDVRFAIQAGTCEWRFRDATNLPLSEPDCYGHQWDPNHPVSIMAIQNGLLPEIHVWLALVPPDEPTLVDFSTEYFHKGCPYKWETKLPPPVMWLPQSQQERMKTEFHATYIADYDATRYAMDRVASAVKMLKQWM